MTGMEQQQIESGVLVGVLNTPITTYPIHLETLHITEPLGLWQNPQDFALGLQQCEEQFQNREWDLPTDVSIHPKMQLRESIQSPESNSVYTPDYLRKLAQILPEDTWIELGGCGQLAAEIGGQIVDYTEEMLKVGLRETKFRYTLHVANRLELAKQSIDFLAKLPEDIKAKIAAEKALGRDIHPILNTYWREENKPTENLQKILKYADSKGISGEHIRVGGEHNGSNWLNYAREFIEGNPNGLQKFMHQVNEIFTLARDNKFPNMSMPETTGTLTPAQSYYYTWANLCSMHNSGYTPKAMELHLHNDRQSAWENYCAASTAIRDFNYQFGTNIEILFDLTPNGVGERNGIQGLNSVLAQRFGLDDNSVAYLQELERQQLGIIPMNEEEKLATTTGGTHANVYEHRVLEAISLDEELTREYGVHEHLEPIILSINAMDEVERAKQIAEIRELLIAAIKSTYCNALYNKVNPATEVQPQIKIGHYSSAIALQMSRILELADYIPTKQVANAIIAEIKQAKVIEALGLNNILED